MKEPTLKKALEPYLEGLDKNINYVPEGFSSSALFLSTLYATQAGTFSITEEDLNYAKKVVELLLKYGADPNKHEGDNPDWATPLTLARDMNKAGKDPLNIYDLFLKHSLNSASGGVAFEAEPAGNRIKEALSKAIKGLGNLGKKGAEGIDKVTDKVLGKIYDVFNGKANKKILQEAKDLADSEKSGQKKGSDQDNFSEAAEKVFGIPKLVTDSNTDKKVKAKLGQILSSSDNPFSHPLLKLVKTISSYLDRTPSDSRIWGLIINPKFSDLQNLLRNLSGMSKDPTEFTNQLSYIGYYLANGKNLKLLKDKDGNWRNLDEMKSVSAGKEEDPTGRQLILGYLKKEGPSLSKGEGLKFIASEIFKGDNTKAGAFLEENSSKISEILNKKFTKAFDDDNLLDKLKKEFLSLVKEEETGEETEEVPKAPETGREIILDSIKKEGPSLSKNDGLKFIADSLFKGDIKKSAEFFENNRKEVSKLLNRKYQKTFDEDNISDLFVNDLKSIVSKSGDSNTLTPEQQEAALALQGLKYSKKDSLNLVKGKTGNSAEIIVQALKEKSPPTVSKPVKKK